MSLSADLEAEIRDLAARRDIKEAIHNYMRGQDRLMPEVQRSAFHDDAHVDAGIFNGGPDAYVDFAQGVLGEFKSSQHLIGQVHISIDGDVAHGEVYFLAQHRTIEDGEEKDLFVAGRYIDRYENRGGDWRITRRRELVDWARTDPATDSFIKAETELHLAARGNDDFSNTRNWPT